LPGLAPGIHAFTCNNGQGVDCRDEPGHDNGNRGAFLMQTNFSLAQLADPQTAASEKILRACVHCGFCTATCPTYVLLGDELDSPRGRIYLIKDMLEEDKPASREVVKHIDRCLSCLSCMTTCPSGVHYMHLVDHARERIEKTYKRPLADRLMRALLARVLTDPAKFRLAMTAGMIARPFAPVFNAIGLTRMAAMLRLTPRRKPAPPVERTGKVYPAQGARRGRVALLSGCINPVLAPSTDEAAIRLLNRNGIEVVVAAGEACCGSLSHHMGREDEALAFARNNIDAWTREIEGEGLDAILITVSGCGTTIKDYGFMLRTDAAYAGKAAKVAALAKDISEYLAPLPLKPSRDVGGLTLAYHSACSLQHGQKITREPKDLLSRAGFTVRDVPEGHLCCGSAGTYNILQPDIARALRARKVANIESVAPDVIAAGNIGCITQIAGGTGIPVVHTVELLDWATGGPLPEPLAEMMAQRQPDTVT
jgi:glycolate oxidase iron-sulfur subunit